MRLDSKSVLPGVLLVLAACTNDFGNILPAGDGPAAGGAGSATGPGSGGGPSASSSASSGPGGASSSASTGGVGGAPVGGAGPGGAQGGDGGVGGEPNPNPNCGNGALDPGEQCDGGTPQGGDGCSAACMLEGNPQGGCSAQVNITALPLWISGDTSTSTNFTEAPGCFAIDGKDAVYKITVPTAGTLVAKVDTIGWAGVMALRGGCGPGDGFCGAVFPSNTMERAMSANESAHVLVTGVLSSDQGPYTVTLTLE